MVSLTSIKNNVAAAAASAASGVKNGVVGTGKLLGNQDTQNRVNAMIADKADGFRASVAGQANSAIRFLNETGVETLKAPLKSMQNFSIERLATNKEDNGLQVAYKNTRNFFAAGHEKTIRGGEKISRIAGDQINALARVPFIPVVGLLKLVGLTQIAKGVELIGNAVALAAGFAVRGAILAVSQLAHFAILAVETVTVATVTAVAITTGVVALGLMKVFGDVLTLYLLREDRRNKAEIKDMKDNTLMNRAKAFVGTVASNIGAVAAKAYENKGKIATATATGAAAIAAHQYGLGNIVSAIGSYFAAPTAPVVASAANVVSRFEGARGVVVNPAAIAGLNQLMTQGSTGIASQDAARLLINGSRVAISA